MSSVYSQKLIATGLRYFKLATSLGNSNKVQTKRAENDKPEEKPLDLSDKVAIITGGASYFGTVCVRELIRCGVKGVMITDTNEEEGQKKLCEISKGCTTDKVAFIKSDIGSPLLLRNAFHSAKLHFKGLNIIINVTEQCSKKTWTDEINKNIIGLVRSTLLGYEVMGTHNGGSGGVICNLIISSTSENDQMAPVFMATKNHMVNFAKCMSYKFSECTGVKVITAFAASDVNMPKPNKEDLEFRRDSLPNMLENSSPGSVWKLHFASPNK